MVGHYVRRTFPTQEEPDAGVKPEMLRGLDSNKDNAKFTSYTPLSSDQVARSLIPCGWIREAWSAPYLVEEQDLITAKEKDFYRYHGFI